jgi:hypothetical protein
MFLKIFIHFIIFRDQGKIVLGLKSKHIYIYIMFIVKTFIFVELFVQEKGEG